jgi:hypothetical protein
MSENHVIGRIEAAYMTKRRRDTYLALDDLDFDFTWSLGEVREMKHLWNEGTALEEIAEHFDRDIDECFILLFDLARKGKIKYRKNSIYGG